MGCHCARPVNQVTNFLRELAMATTDFMCGYLQGQGEKPFLIPVYIALDERFELFPCRHERAPSLCITSSVDRHTGCPVTQASCHQCTHIAMVAWETQGEHCPNGSSPRLCAGYEVLADLEDALFMPLLDRFRRALHENWSGIYP